MKKGMNEVVSTIKQDDNRLRKKTGISVHNSRFDVSRLIANFLTIRTMTSLSARSCV